MKKQLLMGALLLGSLLSANAQGNSCANATVINGNGTYTSTAISGTYGNNCWGGTQTNQNPTGPLMSNWYVYYAPANGLLTISSDVAANPANTDTRLSVFTGACNALVCYNGNDDINGAAQNGNYRSLLTIPVAVGETYYIAWDNLWSSAGFDFTINFVENDCLSPNELDIKDVTNVTANSATVNWFNAIGNPAGYEVIWGAPNFDVATEGTIVTTTTNSANLTGLPENGTVWYYVRAACGSSQGTWVGPFAISLAVEMPYSNNFDAAGNSLDGFVSLTGWGNSTSTQNGPLAHTPNGFIFSNVSTTAASNSWMLMRPVSLVAGEDVTITFQSKLIPAAATGNLQVSVGTSPDVATHMYIADFALTGVAQTGAYTPYTATYSAPADGIYYFGLHNNSGTSAAAGSILVDTVAMSSVLGTEEAAAANFAVYPNPATNVINIANAENILVNGVEIVDINGRTVKSVKFNNVSEAQINVSDLSAGMYLMNISSERGTTTHKIVKN